MSDVDDRPRHMVITTEREEGDRVRLTVKDDAVGLDPQAMDRLFEAFYTTKNDGMGMGLSVSRSIIERHHGRLWAAPNDGPGATFSFSIPCGPASAPGARSLGVIGTPAVKAAKRFQGNPRWFDVHHSRLSIATSLCASLSPPSSTYWPLHPGHLRLREVSRPRVVSP